jgi:hypothetical protein
MRSAAGEYVRAFPEREIKDFFSLSNCIGYNHRNNSRFRPRIQRCLTHLDAQPPVTRQGILNAPARTGR